MNKNIYPDNIDHLSLTDIVIKNLLHRAWLTEEKSSVIIDQCSFLDALFDAVNICKEYPFAIDQCVKWIIYESITHIETETKELFKELEFHTAKALCYLVKFFKDETGYISFVSISSDGTLDVLLDGQQMDYKKKIESDVKDFFSEFESLQVISVSLREHLEFLKKLDERHDGLLDFNKIVNDLLQRLDKKDISKAELAAEVKLIELENYLGTDYTSVTVNKPKAGEKLDHEILFDLAVKLMETAITAKIYHQGRIKYEALPFDSSGYCFFKELPERSRFKNEKPFNF